MDHISGSLLEYAMHLTRRQLIALAAIAPAAALALPTPTSEILPYESTRVGDIDIAYRVTGAGDPLLMITGFVATMDTWDPTFIAALSERYQVIVFDLRGTGGSTASGSYPFSQIADDTAGLIAALGLGNANVFGWSLGAMIAADLAIRHADVVRELILHAGDAGGPDAIRVSPDVFTDLFDTPWTGNARRDIGIDLLLPPEWVEQHQEYVDQVFSRPIGPVTAQGAVLQGKAFLEWYEQPHDIGSIALPTLIVHGTEDQMIPVDNAQILADSIPGSWLIRIPGGHGVQFQVPREIASMVDLFLKSGV
jgi:pimeloyl-ACP methyl ester carboxylesterase